MKKQAVICYSLGELYWEIARFAPHIIYMRRKKYKDLNNTHFIIATHPSRFDIYGNYGNIYVPLRMADDPKYTANCYRLDGYPEVEYNNLGKVLKNQFSGRYDIVEVIYPKVSKNQFSNKRQFPSREYTYKYSPRPENLEVVNSQIKTDKKLVVIAPRYRKGLRRNWPYWQKFYNMLYENKDLMNRFEFIICGKLPDCIPDEHNRFLDINNFPVDKNTSLIGYTIEILKKSVFTVGSQSGIPNISLLFGVEVLEWGHQKQFHTIDYNIFKTKVTFLEDMKYDLKPEVIIKNMASLLKGK